LRPQILLARSCLLLAIAGASYLAAISLTNGAVAGCGPGSGCSQVLASRWAYWFGIPVSIPALAAYIALLVTTWRIEPGQDAQRHGAVRLAMAALSGMVVAAALWFVFVQYAILGKWCPFCLITHSCAVAASVCLLHFVFRNLRNDPPPASGSRRPAGLGLGLGIAVLGFAVLVAGQNLVKKRLYGLGELAVQAASNSQRVVLFDGRFALDPGEVPVLGSTSAREFAVCLFDYTCVHCRRLHPLLKAAAERSGGRFAVISLPAPLDAACNPLVSETQAANRGACDYARLGLAVWRARPAGFPDFDEWLLASDSPPPLDEARAKAEALVGKDALAEALASPWVRDQLNADVKLYIASSTATQNERLPQIIFADSVAYGQIDDAAELKALIDSHEPLRRTIPAQTAR
jgi:uncharacterized membrane protein/protein-disulfide isomerase